MVYFYIGKFYLLKLVEGLKALHDAKVFHRDVKVNFINKRVQMFFCTKMDL